MGIDHHTLDITSFSLFTAYSKGSRCTDNQGLCQNNHYPTKKRKLPKTSQKYCDSCQKWHNINSLPHKNTIKQ